jgi:hypothetical protein
LDALPGVSRRRAWHDGKMASIDFMRWRTAGLMSLEDLPEICWQWFWQGASHGLMSLEDLSAAAQLPCGGRLTGLASFEDLFKRDWSAGRSAVMLSPDLSFIAGCTRRFGVACALPVVFWTRVLHRTP